jgi:hypothetical protein
MYPSRPHFMLPPTACPSKYPQHYFVVCGESVIQCGRLDTSPCSEFRYDFAREQLCQCRLLA